MVDTSKGYYLELEQRLYSLRGHFALCQGLRDEETLDWAKFFLTWSQKASKCCDSWSAENLRVLDNLILELQKSKGSVTGYEVLEGIMAVATNHLNQEILKNLRGGETKSPILKPLEKKSLVSVADSQGFIDDTDSPQSTRL